MISTGLRPIRSDSRPQKGSPRNWPKEKAENSSVTCQAGGVEGPGEERQQRDHQAEAGDHQEDDGQQDDQRAALLRGVAVVAAPVPPHSAHAPGRCAAARGARR